MLADGQSGLGDLRTAERNYIGLMKHESSLL